MLLFVGVSRRRCTTDDAIARLHKVTSSLKSTTTDAPGLSDPTRKRRKRKRARHSTIWAPGRVPRQRRTRSVVGNSPVRRCAQDREIRVERTDGVEYKVRLRPRLKPGRHPLDLLPRELRPSGDSPPSYFDAPALEVRVRGLRFHNANSRRELPPGNRICSVVATLSENDRLATLELTACKGR